jgi:hypothetical protein
LSLHSVSQNLSNDLINHHEYLALGLVSLNAAARINILSPFQDSSTRSSTDNPSQFLGFGRNKSVVKVSFNDLTLWGKVLMKSNVFEESSESVPLADKQ